VAARTADETRRTRWLGGALLLALGALVYGNTFSVPFVFDDFGAIVDNPLVRDFGLVLDPARRAAAEVDGRPAWPAFRGRIVAVATGATNFAAHGLAVAGFHAVNLAIHLLNGLLVAALAALVLARARSAPSAGALARWAPWAAAALWLAHPLQTQAVTYLCQRFTSLAALFFLVATLLYARAAGGGGRFRPAAYLGALVAAALGMLSKQNAFTLLGVLALWELAFESAPARRRLLRLAPFALLTGALFWWSLLGADPSGTGAPGVGLGDRVAGLSGSVLGFSRWDYLATQARVIVSYLRLLVLPVGQNLVWDVRVSTSFAEPAVLATGALSVALCCLGAWLVARGRHGDGRWLPVGFGLLWFYVTLSVESSVIPIYDVLVEHRLYLPSVGVVLATLGALVAIHERHHRLLPARALLGALGVAALALAGATLARNAIWSDPVRLWEDVVAKSPRHAGARRNLGVAYQDAGRAEDAVRETRVAAHLDPADGETFFNLGVLNDHLGRRTDAIAAYETAVRLAPRDTRALDNLGIGYGRLGRLPEAVAALEASLAISSDNAIAWSNLGILYSMQGRPGDAERAWRAALASDPADPRARAGLAGLGRAR
jgi:Flp pilus assembly protein TadD